MLSTEANSPAFRARILTDLGAGRMEIDQLLAYGENTFHRPAGSDEPFPLEDEKFVASWRSNEQASASEPIFQVLKKPLVQLNFPIQPGIAQTPLYRNIVYKGHTGDQYLRAHGLELKQPDSIKLRLHQTAAGTIPILEIPDRKDFEAVLQAILHKNEPTVIPRSLGAMMVSGYTNWDRIHRHEQAWRDKQQGAPGITPWEHEFKRFLQDRSDYQDRLILLGSGPYSNVPAAALQLDSTEWLRLSLEIRMHHESVHYFTRRYLGSMRNNLLDETIADFIALIQTTGSFHGSWFLHFMGLERFPDYREGGRLQNYRGEPRLSDPAFFMLQKLVHAISRQLERFSRSYRTLNLSLQQCGSLITGMSELSLEALAAPDAPRRIREAIDRHAHHSAGNGRL